MRQCNHVSPPPLETEDDCGAQPKKNLVFASLFSITEAFENISQDTHEHRYDYGGTEGAETCIF